MITVRELIAVGGFDEQSVLAGEAFLDKELLGVTSFDSPDGHKWLRPGEFVLTTGYPFVAHRETSESGLIRLIDDLTEIGTPGIAIKLGRYIDELPRAVIEHAGRKQMPILAFPMEKAWSDVIVPVVRYINDKQRAELDRTHAIYERFHRHLTAGAPVSALAQLLHEALQVPVCIYVPSLRWQWTAPALGAFSDLSSVDRECGLPAPHHLLAQPLVTPAAGTAIRWLLLSQQVYGAILIQQSDRELYAWEKVAIEQSAALLSLELERQRTVSETFQRFRNEFLQALLSGQTGPRDVLLRKAEEVGWALAEDYQSLVMSVRTSDDDPVDGWRRNRELLELINGILARSDTAGLTGLDRDNHVVLLVPTAYGQCPHLESLLCSLGASLAKSSVSPIPVGIGRFHPGWDGIAHSYREAKISFRTVLRQCGYAYAKTGAPPLRIQHYHALALERILFAEEPSHEAQVLAAECLDKLLQYDAEKNGQLVETLQAFLFANGNHVETANRLFVHKNTVKYRMQLIRELTGLTPENGQDQLLFRIALTVHAIGRQPLV